jgi:transcriptional antiterminator NusG
VKEIDPVKQELRVAVTIFGRETPVTVRVSEVEKIQ